MIHRSLNPSPARHLLPGFELSPCGYRHGQGHRRHRTAFQRSYSWSSTNGNFRELHSKGGVQQFEARSLFFGSVPSEASQGILDDWCLALVSWVTKQRTWHQYQYKFHPSRRVCGCVSFSVSSTDGGGAHLTRLPSLGHSAVGLVEGVRHVWWCSSSVSRSLVGRA
jgi:hypothetical protein